MPCEELLTAILCIEGGDATPTVDPTIEGGGSGTSVSAMMRNLLPLAGLSLGGCIRRRRGPTGPTEAGRTDSEGRMGELLPEFWSALNEEARMEVKGRWTRKVTDIFTWLQCSASYVAVRVMMTPRLAPELMAYQSTIVRVSQDFVGFQGL